MRPSPRRLGRSALRSPGGDMMPWMFRHTKTGTLVGKRTWGGSVGLSFFNPDGQWGVANKGMAPDIEVGLDPKAVHDGHDPQLAGCDPPRRVAVALQQLK